MTRSTVRRAAGACLLLLCLTLACSSNSDDQSPRVPADIVLVPNQPRIAQGLGLKLKATVVDASGREISGKHPVFSSSDTTLVKVDNSGNMLSVGGTGTLQVTADLNGLTSSVTVEVTQRIVSMTVQPDSLVINLGLQTFLTVSLLDYLGLPAAPTSPLVFTSQNTSLVTVDNSGFVTAGNSSGKTTITVRMDTLQVVLPVRVGRIPADMVISPSSLLLTSGSSQQLSVTVHDQAGAVIASPVLSYTSTNTSVFTVTSGGMVHSVGPSGSGVVRIKIESLEQDLAVLVGSTPALTLAHTTDVDPSTYAADIGPGGVMVVSASGGASVLRGTLPAYDLPTAITTSGTPLGVAINHAGTRAYIASEGQVSVVNLSNNTAITAIPLLGGVANFSVEVTADDQKAYVGTGNGVYVIDLTTNRVIDSIYSGNSTFIALSPTQPKLYVSEGSVREVDLNTKVVRAFTGGGNNKDIAVSPDGTELYSADEGTGALQVFSVATRRLIQTVPSPAGAFGLAVSAKWIALATGSTVVVFDRVSRYPISTIPVGGTPRRPAIDPGQTTIVVPNEAGWVDFIK